MTETAGAKSPHRKLTVSIVTFRSDADEFRRTLSSLRVALQDFSGDDVAIFVIDNSPQNELGEIVAQELASWTVEVLHGHGNVGFGRAHNLILDRTGEYHLILNPDIEMRPDALQKALRFLEEHPACGLLTPMAYWPDGCRQYLCKRYPALFDLLLRGFAPARLAAMFDQRLARYEMRAETQDEVHWEPPIVSGCFMFFRGDVLRALGGFDEAYFLYFEDFDLSLRAGKKTQIAYVPAVRVVHAGGKAGKKGWWHIRQFGKSAVRFYATHGLKLF